MKAHFAKFVLLALAVAGSSALAQSQAACCMRGSSTANNGVRSAGLDSDEKFFLVQGAPPNLIFLIDNSGSMNDLPYPADDTPTRAAGTGCNNTLYDAIIVSNGFNPPSTLGGAVTQPVDMGVDPPNWNGDTGWPDLFRSG